MFKFIRDLISSRRTAMRAKVLIAKSKHRTDRLVARADRAAISQLAVAVDGIRFALSSMLKTPSSTSTPDVGLTIFLSRVMGGVAGGAAELADYLTEKADLERKEEGLKTAQRRKDDRLAQIIGAVYMSLGHGKSVSFVVEAEAVAGIALSISEVFKSVVVTIEDGEPGKNVLVVREVSEDEGDEKGDGESVH